VGQLIGQALGTLYMGQKFIKETHNLYKPKIFDQLKLAKRYKNFPKFILIANTMNTASRHLPSIFFNMFFTQIAAGFYLIVNLAIGVPITIVSIAIGDVFRQQASVAYAERGECLNEYKKIFKKLLMISLLPFGLFAIIAPDLFEIIFGKNWRIAGEYAQILTPMFLLKFISNPLSNMFLVAEKQKLELLLQTILLVATVLCFFMGLMFNDIILTICLISAVNTLMYGIMALMSFKFAKGIVK
jgi:O-antigen/teichoic acid export membrane protein